MTEAYFFDTYALLRTYLGEAAFARFAAVPVITDHGCLFEFTRQIMVRKNAKAAREALVGLRAERIVPADDDLVEAAKLMRKLPRLSAQDAMGYTLARRERLLFLTGDRAFRNLPGVEFVE